MKNNLQLLPLTESDLPELEQWHSDASVHSRYGGADWPRKLLELVQADTNRTCWVAWEHAKRIGYVDCEVKESAAWIGLVVNPAIHGQGHGKRILHSFMALPFLHGLHDVRAGIEVENIASLRCFRGAGFVQLNEEPDHEGILNFSHELKGATLDEVIRTIIALPRVHRKTLIVAIDGHGGSGKSTFAKRLAERLQEIGNKVSIVGLDGFPLRKEPEHFLSLHDHPNVKTPFRIDTDRIRAEVLEPLSENHEAIYSQEDWWDETKTTRHVISTSGIVLIEGCYALLPELRSYYDFKILIDTHFDTSKERAIQRDLALGANPEIGKLLWDEIYYPHEKQYMETERIQKIVDMVIADF